MDRRNWYNDLPYEQVIKMLTLRGDFKLLAYDLVFKHMPSLDGIGNSFNKRLLYDYGRILAQEVIKQNKTTLVELKASINSPFYHEKLLSEDPQAASFLLNHLIKGLKEYNLGILLAGYGLLTDQLDKMAIIDKRLLYDFYLKPLLDNLDLVDGVITEVNLINGEVFHKNTFSKQRLQNKIVASKYDIITIDQINDYTLILTDANYLQQLFSMLEVEYEKIKDKAYQNGNLKRTLNNIYDKQLEDETLNKIALEGICLLRNDNNILPIKKTCSIVIGQSINKFDDIVNGCFYDDIDSYTNNYKIFDFKQDDYQIKQFKKEYDKYKYKIIFYEYEEKTFVELKLLLKEKKGDVIVVVLNAPFYDTILDELKTIIFLPNLGVKTYKALMKLLYGEDNFSGRLSYTWGKMSIDESKKQLLYKSSVNHGYHYFYKYNQKVYFPFSSGISYSTYTYENLEVSKNFLYKHDRIKVCIQVKNCSLMQGLQTVFLFIKYPDKQIYNEGIKLLDFQKCSFKKDEKKVLEFFINYEDLQFYNDYTNTKEVMDGVYQIIIGEGLNGQCLNAQIQVFSNKNTYFSKEITSFYNNEEKLDITDEVLYRRVGIPWNIKVKKYNEFSKIVELENHFFTQGFYHKLIKGKKDSEVIKIDNLPLISLMRLEKFNQRRLNRIISYLNKDFLTIK